MQLTDTLDAYLRLRAKAIGGLPAMEIASLRIETRALTDPVAALQELERWKPRQGWLQFQSRTLAFSNGELPEPLDPADRERGLLLDAEVIANDDSGPVALSLRSLSPGSLRLVIAHPLAAGAGEQDYLTDEVKQLATKKTGHKWLRYRRYWRRDQTAGLLPFFAAFQGFVD